jgi:hypothetical protein
MPSSSSRAHTCAGDRSQYSSERSTNKMRWRSASDSRFAGSRSVTVVLHTLRGRDVTGVGDLLGPPEPDAIGAGRFPF